MARKFINKPENLTSELLEGMTLAFKDVIELGGANKKLVINKELYSADRVTVVSIGGTGHEPAQAGFVGPGMLDITVAGDIFAAPGPQDVVEAIKIADRGKGVLLIVLNHAGDILTGNVVMNIAKDQGLNVKRVVTQEDISSAPRSEGANRRGLVGAMLLHHIAGAAAAMGKSLEEVTEIAQRFANNMATITVATKGATHPSTGLAISTYGDSEMGIGAGQHGESGISRMPMMSADEVTDKMMNMLLDDLSIEKGERLMVVVNGAGSTTLMELCIVFRRCHYFLAEKGIEIVASYCGDLITTQEQAGFQMFIARMDDELIELWNKPCRTPYFSK